VFTAPVTVEPMAPVDVARVVVARRSTETWYVATAVLVPAVAVRIEVSEEVTLRLAPTDVTVKALIFVIRSSICVPSCV